MGRLRVDEKQFWDTIGPCGKKALTGLERQLSGVRKRLAQMTPAEIKSFDRLFNQKMKDAYTWDLWGAAYLINGGCSDDGFFYFCAWLISRGPKVFAAALQNPDSLAKVVDADRDDHEFEELWHVARQVYQEEAGKELAGTFRWPAKPKGKRWDFDDDEEMLRRFPKLAKHYLS
jgi:hypothetical protein